MPIPFIPMLLGVAAVGISSAAVSFLFGELTEEEKRKQEQMRKEAEQFKNEQAELARQYCSDPILNAEQLQRELQQQYDENQRAQYETFTKRYKNMTFAHMKEAENIREQIREARNRMNDVIKKEKTILRKEALNYLFRELQVGFEKAEAYVSYLKGHSAMISKYQYELDAEDFLFEFRLPEHYPYVGKIIYVQKEAFNDAYLEQSLNKYTSYTMHVVDEEERHELPDNANIPLFIENYVKKEGLYEASIGKGMFSLVALQQSKVGVQATVAAYTERGHIEMSYKGVPLSMRINDLKNPLKVPLIDSTVRVYPISWHGLLRNKVYVSEKYEDSLRAFQFTTLPIVFDEVGADEFINYYEEQNQDCSSEEWKIGPIEESFLKLQLSDFLIFRVEMIQTEKPYLRFDRLLPLSDAFKVDDIFLVMDAEFELVVDSEMHLLNEESFQNMYDLNTMIVKEIQIQEQLKNSKEGLQFFGKWAEVTEQLIHYLSKGSTISCQLGGGQVSVKQLPLGKLFKHSYDILNPDEIIQALNEQLSNERPQFFIDKQLKVEFDETNSHLIYYSNNRELTFAHQTVTVYEKNYCYPEQQQLLALESFREGTLVNAKLQPFILNGKNVESETVPLPLLTFKNKGLLTNPSQKYAVELGLKEQNIALVQGPPGTGKTTVIRELIHQHLKLSPNMRILIVSQANVAIDNVLKGLDEQLTAQMIRCGNVDKIDEALQPISFDEKYATYTKLLDESEVAENLSPYAKQWQQIVSNDDRSQAPIIGEIFVRNHKIVGATCLGLMQRKIGLNRVIFDLVIIDEAGKALPAELLIPINRAKKCIIIGDHKQLPPVINPALYDAEKVELVEAEYCQNDLFTTSLFKRLYETLPETNKTMLNTQYRMPAIIGNMISKFFYDGQLISHESTHQRKTKYFDHHLNLLNMDNDFTYQEQKINQTITNEREAEIVVQLVEEIRKTLPINEKIAVICPYKGQNRFIRNMFRQQGIDIYEQNISVNTIDAYQGDEAEIVLYCMTRAKRKTAYFSDEARLNVAFSRVKNDLLVIGSLNYLKKYGDAHIVSKIAQYIETHGKTYTYEQLIQKAVVENI